MKRKLIPSEEQRNIRLTPEHIAELDRRLDALDIEPKAGTAWKIVRERVLRALKHQRA